MKKRFKRGEIRAIKIDEDALYEFIRESVMEKSCDFFDQFDHKDSALCMRWNKADNSFTCIAYHVQDRHEVDFDQIDSTLDFTTSTLFRKHRYVTLDLKSYDPPAE